MASLDDSGNSEDDEDQLSNAIENAVAHFIQINTDAGDNSFDEYSPEKIKECFSHVATPAEMDEPDSLAARLQNVAFAHAVMEAVPKWGFADTFEGILIDTAASRGSSTG